MSNEAITWALSQPVKHSTAKFVLVVMANHADANWIAFPSVASLTEATAQDRKTVLENIKRLVIAGYLEDTLERKGATKQVIVYRLKSPEIGTVTSASNVAAGHPKESQKRNSTESGTVPEFPSNSPVFSVEQSQFSVVTVPKTGHGTLNEPSIETKGKPQRREQQAAIELPDWVPADAWDGFLNMRKTIKKPITADAVPIALRKLDSLRMTGNDARSVLEQSTMNCWQGLFEVKQEQARASLGGNLRMGKAGQETAQAAQRLIDKFKAENEQAN